MGFFIIFLREGMQESLLKMQIVVRFFKDVIYTEAIQ